MAPIRMVGPRPSAPDHVTDKKYVDDQVAVKYTKPAGGIPKEDTTSAVQASLARADTSIQDADPRLTDDRNPKYHEHNGEQVLVTLNIDNDPLVQSVTSWLGLFYQVMNGVVENVEELQINKANLIHFHAASGITDATTTGRSVLTATDAAAARNAIGAGTSSLEVGPGMLNAMAGNTKAQSIGGVGSYVGKLTEIWWGTEAEYNALPAATKNAAGFIAVYT